MDVDAGPPPEERQPEAAPEEQQPPAVEESGVAAKPFNEGAADRQELRQREFFAVAPTQIVQELVDALSNYVCDAADALQTSMQRDFPSVDVEQGVERLLGSMLASLELNLDKFELFALRNVFHIPDDADLEPGPIGDGTLASVEEMLDTGRTERTLDADILALRGEILALRKAQTQLRQRNEAQQKDIERYSTVAELIEKIRENAPRADVATMLRQIEQIKSASGKCKDLLDEHEENSAPLTPQKLLDELHARLGVKEFGDLSKLDALLMR